MAHRFPSRCSCPVSTLRPIAAVIVAACVLAACSKQVSTALPTSPTDGSAASSESTSPSTATSRATSLTTASAATRGPVRVVLFTHIEDNTPARRARRRPRHAPAISPCAHALIEMGERTRATRFQWTLQPDWKICSRRRGSTKTRRRWRRPAARTSFATCATISASPSIRTRTRAAATTTPTSRYLLDSLGVGGSTVIGGHIWDPSLAAVSGVGSIPRAGARAAAIRRRSGAATS